MFILKLKQLFAASVSLLVLGASSVVAAAPATGREQIPNPYVSYATYQDAARVLGFCPCPAGANRHNSQDQDCVKKENIKRKSYWNLWNKME